MNLVTFLTLYVALHVEVRDCLLEEDLVVSLIHMVVQSPERFNNLSINVFLLSLYKIHLKSTFSCLSLVTRPFNDFINPFTGSIFTFVVNKLALGFRGFSWFSFSVLNAACKFLA